MPPERVPASKPERLSTTKPERLSTTKRARVRSDGPPLREAPAAGPETAWPLIVVMVVVAIETAVLAASALWLTAYQLLGHRPHDPLDAWLVVIFAAMGAVALGLMWRGVFRHRRWARSPAVLTQLLTIPVGVNACGDGVWWVGVPLLVCGALGLVGLFAPSTTHAFIDD